MFDVVTGGAGFIGSHLVDALVARGGRVLVIDSLCMGKRETIAQHLDSGRVTLLQCDLLGDGWQDALSGAARVWHLAADPDVRQSAMAPEPVPTSRTRMRPESSRAQAVGSSCAELCWCSW